MTWIRVAALLFLIAQSACVQAHLTLRVALPALLADVQKYDSRDVQTGGYALETSSGLMLFFSEEDARHRMDINGIFLEIDTSDEEGRDLLSRARSNYVVVSGRFEALGAGAGILRGVDSVVVHVDEGLAGE